MKTILDHRRVDTVLDLALRTAAEIGVGCKSPGIVSAVLNTGIAEYSGDRLLFPRKRLHDFLTKRKSSIAAESRSDGEPVTFGSQWHSWELCDPVTNTPRAATEDEAIDMAHLAESLGSEDSPIPVAPEGIPPRLHTLECERLALLHTRGLGGRLPVANDEEIRVISEMHQAAGRRYCLAIEPLISPLTLDDVQLDLYLRWRDRADIDITVFGAIPMAGATAPIVFPASLAQILAESLILDYVLHTLSGGALESFSLRLDPFDMRFTNIVFGSPEWCVLKQLLVELWEGIFGAPPCYGSFRTNGRSVDAQTVMERTASFMWQVQLGLRHFSAVGQICIDEVFSPVQAIIDGELVAYANRIERGIDGLWDDEIDSLSVIAEGSGSRDFLSHQTTLDGFRKFYEFDRLSTAQNLASWRNAGSGDMQQAAWEKAKNLIARHEFELGDQSRRDVLDAYEKGKGIIR